MGGMSSRMTCEDVVKCMNDHEENKKKGASAMESNPSVSSPASAPAPETAQLTGNTAVGGGSKKSKKSKKKKHNKSNKKQKKKSIKKNKNKNKRKSGQKRK